VRQVKVKDVQGDRASNTEEEKKRGLKKKGRGKKEKRAWRIVVRVGLPVFM
jgi:hypothetical protein